MAFEKVIVNFPVDGTEKMVRDRFAKYKVELSRVAINSKSRQVEIVTINSIVDSDYMTYMPRYDWNSKEW